MCIKSVMLPSVNLHLHVKGVREGLESVWFQVSLYKKEGSLCGKKHKHKPKKPQTKMLCYLCKLNCKIVYVPLINFKICKHVSN